MTDPGQREQMLRDFIGMYAARAQQALMAYRGGADVPTVLIMAEVDERGVVADMRIQGHTLEEAAAALDQSRVTVRLLMRQLDAIVQGATAARRCAMGLRFPDGEVLSHVIQLARAKRA